MALPTIYIDTDTYSVTPKLMNALTKHGLRADFFAHSGTRTAADNWVVSEAKPNDILVISDIHLASRTFANGVHVLAASGEVFTEDSIAAALANPDESQSLQGAAKIKLPSAQFLKALTRVVASAKEQATAP